MITRWPVTTLRNRPWAAGLALAAVCLALPLSAQNNSLPRELFSPDLLAAPRLTPQEIETINRAIQDLKSDNPEIRAGACMLLGKYHANEAKEAVLKALDDPSPRVRRAALVSIAEWRNGLSVNAVEPILSHISDPDVEVRRSVSSIIPQMMNIWRTARMVRPDFQQREIKDSVQDSLMRAYRDEDAVVRRNMLIAHHNMNLPVPPEVFVTLLGDEDAEVRREAIPLAIGYGRPDQWREPALAIIEGDDRSAQLRLTAELGRRGSPEGLELLGELAMIQNEEIAAEARLALFRWMGEPHQLQWLLKALSTNQLTQDQGQRFIQILGGYRELAIPLIPSLTELRSAVLRQEAVRLFFILNVADQQPEIVERLLVDTNQEIRNMAMGHFYSNPQLITEERIYELLDNPYPDVRASLIQLAMRMPRNEASELMLDLMLDESVEVRVTALEAVSGMRLKGWTEIVESSLQDPDMTMQRTAVVILLRERQFPKREEILRNFIEENPKSPLAPRIRTEIGEGKVIEIDMNL